VALQDSIWNNKGKNVKPGTFVYNSLGYLKTRQWIHNQNISYYLDYGSTTKFFLIQEKNCLFRHTWAMLYPLAKKILGLKIKDFNKNLNEIKFVVVQFEENTSL
jgi:hypothetical protein